MDRGLGLFGSNREICSIWHFITETEFRTRLVALEQQTNAVPTDVLTTQVNLYVAGNTDSTNEGLRLPLSVEHQVANDFAFITAVREGAQSVAAVCLEVHCTPQPLLRLCIAAADTIDSSVRSVLTQIGETLTSSAANGIPRLEALLSVFKHVLTLHKDRILGRLRSCKWRKPKHLTASHKKPLWQDFANLVHRVQHIYPSKKERPKRDIVGNRIITLAAQFERFESATGDGELQQLHEVVRSTYEFCRDSAIQAYYSDLEVAKPTAQVSAALKCLHQLEKVGAYWRIAGSLVDASNRHRSIFSNLELVYLSPYPSVTTTIAYETWATTCHVHAEIQLVIHYDAMREDLTNGMGLAGVLWPRVIGTSKYFCYLCFLFVKCHGTYLAANTHGRLYDQWTLPDLPFHSEQVRLRYARVLLEIAGIVEQETQKPPTWRVEPMTSRQNLLLEG